jgi:hypothetical protein
MQPEELLRPSTTKKVVRSQQLELAYKLGELRN